MLRSTLWHLDLPSGCKLLTLHLDQHSGSGVFDFKPLKPQTITPRGIAAIQAFPLLLHAERRSARPDIASSSPHQGQRRCISLSMTDLTYPRAVYEANPLTIMQSVDVAHVFAGGNSNYYLYSLNSMVCYYGLHYHAFVKDADTGIWRMFDDTTASEVSTIYV